MSGVYIKGMEMPRNCHECRLYEADIYFCSVADKGIDIADTEMGRCSFCPLIPVPEHGRLIEAERLKEVFRRNVVSGDVFNQLIDIAPTIIPASKEERYDKVFRVQIPHNNRV